MEVTISQSHAHTLHSSYANKCCVTSCFFLTTNCTFSFFISVSIGFVMSFISFFSSKLTLKISKKISLLEAELEETEERAESAEE